MFNEKTTGFIATAKDSDKDTWRLWAKAFDDTNIRLRLREGTRVYILKDSDHEIMVRGVRR